MFLKSVYKCMLKIERDTTRVFSDKQHIRYSLHDVNFKDRGKKIK